LSHPPEREPQQKLGDKPLKENVGSQGPESRGTVSGERVGSSIEVVKPESYEEFAIMERKDEEQILAELKGHYLEEFVYSFEHAGRRVIGLSWAGVKECAYRMGGIDVVDCRVEDKGDYWLVLAKAVDRTTGSGRYGISTQPKKMNLKDGSEQEDLFSLPKALSKAQRNAIRGLIPEQYIKTFLDHYLQEKRIIEAKPITPKPVEPSKLSELVLVRFLQDVPVIAGVDLKEYGPFKKEDIANLPKENADSLVKSGLAKSIPSPAVPEPSVVEIKSKTGTLLAIAEATPESVVVEPSIEVRADLPLFQNFLIPRVLAPIKEKHGGQYRVDADSQGILTSISLTDSKLDEAKVKELLNAVRWTLERAVEKAGGA